LKLNRWFRTLSIFAFLLGVQMVSSIAYGGILYSFLAINSPVAKVDSTNVVVSQTQVGNYLFTGQLCCGGDGSGTDSNLSLSADLICNNGPNACGPIDITFTAAGGFGFGDAASVSVSLGGTSTDPNTKGFGQICIADIVNICSGSLTGTNAFGFPFSGGSLFGSASGTASLLGGFNVFGDIHLDGLAAGAELDPPLLTIHIGGLTPIAAPEPGTASLILLGCGALLALRLEKAFLSPLLFRARVNRRV